MHNYADVNKRFPPGNITDGNCCSTPSLQFGPFRSLPYLEQSGLFSQYNPSLAIEDPAIHSCVRPGCLPIIALQIPWLDNY